MDLYYTPYSVPASTIRLIAEYLGLSLKLHDVKIFENEQYSPEFEKLNPANKVPTLIDGDFVISESRAIMIYLVEKYGKKNSKILPSDPCQRALVNQALQFDLGKLFTNFFDYCMPMIIRLETEYYPERYQRMEECHEILDQQLESQAYVAGRNLTIADISTMGTVTFISEVFGYNIDKYKNIVKWLNRVKAFLPGYKEIHETCLAELRKVFEKYKP